MKRLIDVLQDKNYKYYFMTKLKNFFDRKLCKNIFLKIFQQCYMHLRIGPRIGPHTVTYTKNPASAYVHARSKTDPFTKDYDQTTSQTLALNEGTKFGATRVGNTVYLTMSGKVGDKAVAPQTVKITASEYQKAFNESIISPVQEVSDLIYQNGNTNPESQISYDGILKHPEHSQTTAYFSKKKGSSRDNFPRIQKYNVKADIIVMPDGSNYQTAFYIQVPNKNGEKEWIVRTSEQSSDLNALVKGLTIMDDNTIEKTLK
jgi:hypothetical protein